MNGIAIVIALGYLATRIPMHQETHKSNQNTGKWTAGVAIVFVWLVLPYVNLVKNLDDWGKYLNPEVWTSPKVDGSTETTAALWDVPYLGRLPGVDFLHLTPTGWFNITWLLLLGLFILLIRRHFREPLAIVPTSWLGRGQLIFLVLLWLMVVGNFERALVNWHPSRLLTEWVITVNAILATLLVLVTPYESDTVTIRPPESFLPFYRHIWVRAIGTVVISSLFFVVTNRIIYHYPANEKADNTIHFRFGPEADWRAKPNLKNAQHK